MPLVKAKSGIERAHRIIKVKDMNPDNEPPCNSTIVL